MINTHQFGISRARHRQSMNDCHVKELKQYNTLITISVELCVLERVVVCMSLLCAYEGEEYRSV